MQISVINQPAITLRTDLRSGDIGQIIYLHGSLYAQEYQWDMTFEGYVAESLSRFALAKDPHQDRLWIAEAGQQIAGCIGIVGHSGAEAQLRWFLVLPAYRGKGLGRRLISEAIQFCRERGFKSIFLWTTSDLKAAAHLYRSSGFQKTEGQTHLIWGKMVTEERYDLQL